MNIGDDILDTRFLQERLDELEDLGEERDPEEQEELDALREAADAGIPDWQYGETLIHERYWKRYAMELAEDIGAISSDYSWPQSHIDWDAAADALAQDYGEIELLDHTYYVRY